MQIIHRVSVLRYLKVWDVEFVVGGQVVGPCSGHHELVPCLLAGLLPRCGDQPEFCHGCFQEVCTPSYQCREVTDGSKEGRKELLVQTYTDQVHKCKSVSWSSAQKIIQRILEIGQMYDDLRPNLQIIHISSPIIEIGKQ